MVSNETLVHRLCADCQRSCKQSPVVDILSCPHYLRIPRQGELLDKKGKPRDILSRKKASKSLCV